jgi:hypothetical protein
MNRQDPAKRRDFWAFIERVVEPPDCMAVGPVWSELVSEAISLIDREDTRNLSAI